jgi:transposase-like protein
MNQQRYTPEFKEEAVRQVTQRGYSVKEAAFRPHGSETATTEGRPVSSMGTVPCL